MAASDAGYAAWPCLDDHCRRPSGNIVAEVFNVGARYGGDFELPKQGNDMALHAAFIGREGAGLFWKAAASENAALFRCRDVLLAKVCDRRCFPTRKSPLNIFRLQGYAVNSRTYYILGLSFWQSEADKLGKVPELPELFA